MVKNFKNELTVEIPKDIKFNIEGKVIEITGKKGTITKDFSHMKEVEIKVNKNEITLTAYFARKSTIAKLGTLKSTIENAFIGVTKGYKYKMKIAYSHFPITVEVKKNSEVILIKNFLGERSPRYTEKADKKIDIKANKEDVVVSGIDKNAVGQTAANIQKRCRIRQKDHRRFQDGIWLYEKYAGEDLIWKLKI